jgi:predicted ArsR family transcriptional regulator
LDGSQSVGRGSIPSGWTVVNHLPAREYAAHVTTPRRPATPDEAKALAHPVRQRIIRLCGLSALTNKQLADRLDRDPATVLHHVRLLVATGFLEPTEERTGPSGATEKPYRSTGRSWTLELDEASPRDELMSAAFQATGEELAAAGPAAMRDMARVVVRLTDDDLGEVLGRIQEVLDEAVSRSAALDDPSLPAHAALFVVHRVPEDTDDA